jgi:phospholipid/cholesterol/gamma-HCH transport system substrate-binding protein
MYASRTTQLIVGIFALLGLAALAFLSLSLGRVELLPAPGYTLYANFDTIAGLKSGDQVQIAGVKVGKVAGVSLEDNRAHVTLRIDEGVKIDNEAFAAVKSTGIIGDKFVSIQLGPGEQTLADGNTIRHTQSAVVLEDLIGQLINNGGSGGSPGGGSSSGSGNGGNAGSTGGSHAGAGDITLPPDGSNKSH